MNSSGSSKPRKRRFDSVEQEAFLELWRTYDRLKELEDELFGRYDLSAQQYNTLRLLRSASPGALRVNELAEPLVSRAPDMTRLLDRLEQRELIQRTRPPENRRVVLVEITPAGIALLDELAGPVRECHRKQLGHLSEADVRTFVALLRKARVPHEPEGSSWGTSE